MQRKRKSNLDSASNHSIHSVVPTAPNTDDLDTRALNAWTQSPHEAPSPKPSLPRCHFTNLQLLWLLPPELRIGSSWSLPLRHRPLRQRWWEDAAASMMRMAWRNRGRRWRRCAWAYPRHHQLHAEFWNCSPQLSSSSSSSFCSPAALVSLEATHCTGWTGRKHKSCACE